MEDDKWRKRIMMMNVSYLQLIQMSNYDRCIEDYVINYCGVDHQILSILHSLHSHRLIDNLAGSGATLFRLKANNDGLFIDDDRSNVCCGNWRRLLSINNDCHSDIAKINKDIMQCKRILLVEYLGLIQEIGATRQDRVFAKNALGVSNRTINTLMSLNPDNLLAIADAGEAIFRLRAIHFKKVIDLYRKGNSDRSTSLLAACLAAEYGMEDEL